MHFHKYVVSIFIAQKNYHGNFVKGQVPTEDPTGRDSEQLCSETQICYKVKSKVGHAVDTHP